jgi:hypothetical protein
MGMHPLFLADQKTSPWRAVFILAIQIFRPSAIPDPYYENVRVRIKKIVKRSWIMVESGFFSNMCCLYSINIHCSKNTIDLVCSSLKSASCDASCPAFTKKKYSLNV